MKAPLGVLAVGTLLGVLSAILPSLRLTTATADSGTPPFVNWATLLPSLTNTYQPNSANQCVAGLPGCVDSTIAEMQRRFDPLAATCDHNAVFSLAYLRTTQTYRWARDQSGFFNDTPWVNHEDAVFAKYYFQAFDNYQAGNVDAAPPAWKIAFDAAATHQATAAGDLLLGMSAHVNRDLPFVLAAIGITTPTGATRKPDHDKVNQFLNAVVQPLLAEIAARFDPSATALQTPYGIGYTALFQLLEAWREQAWRNAELLTDAPDALTRSIVAQQIEATAATEAQTLLIANSYVPLVQSSADRDACCAAHFNDPAPLPYPFGSATP